MATPQYAHLSVVRRSGKGEPPHRIYCSDAAGAVTYADGSSEMHWDEDVKIVDMVFAATLATTPTLTVYVGGQPLTILNTATLAMTSVNRFLMAAPIYVPKGAGLRIVQS